jgi:hypothetical protein
MALYPEGTAPLPLDDVQRAANKANEIARQALGQSGFHVDGSEGSTVNGSFVALQCITEVTFATVVGSNLSGDTLSSFILPAGTILYGGFTSFSTSAGVVIAYKA